MQSSLDGWETLHAIVHLGGFSAAARKLHRSQSTISYAIERLEEQLGVELFEMRGRKACLTEVGRALLAEAEPYMMGFRHIEHKARSLASDHVLDVRLAVDSLYPSERLFAALAELIRRFPYVRPSLRQCTFLSADTEFSAHGAQLCISAFRASECFLQPVMEVRMQAVAHREHPLAIAKAKLTRIDLMQHTLVVIEASDPGRRVQQPRISPLQRFLSVTTVEAAVEAVRAGVGFGWLPLYCIQKEIETRELVPLRLRIGDVRHVSLNLIWRDLGPMQPEMSVLAELLGCGGGVEVV
jgi:DNA-binding transcriptional LysR family regulator